MGSFGILGGWGTSDGPRGAEACSPGRKPGETAIPNPIEPRRGDRRSPSHRAFGYPAAPTGLGGFLDIRYPGLTPGATCLGPSGDGSGENRPTEDPEVSFRYRGTFDLYSSDGYSGCNWRVVRLNFRTMMSFRSNYLSNLSLPLSSVWLLTDVAEAKGRQGLYTGSPERLTSLRQ